MWLIVTISDISHGCLSVQYGINLLDIIKRIEHQICSQQQRSLIEHDLICGSVMPHDFSNLTNPETH